MKTITRNQLYLSYAMVFIFCYFFEQFIFPTVLSFSLYDFVLIGSLFFIPNFYLRIYFLNYNLSTVYTVFNIIVFLHAVKYLQLLALELNHLFPFLNNYVLSLIFIICAAYKFIPFHFNIYKKLFDKHICTLKSKMTLSVANLIQPRAHLYYNSFDDCWYILILVSKNKLLEISGFQSPLHVGVWSYLIQQPHFAFIEMKEDLLYLTFNEHSQKQYLLDLSHAPSEYREIIKEYSQSLYKHLNK